MSAISRPPVAPPTADTVYRWHAGRDEVQARPIAYLPIHGRLRVVARDTAERLHVLDVDAAGARVVAGPVTLGEAIAAADRVVAGVHDHGSVTALVTTIATGLVALAADLELAEGT